MRTHKSLHRLVFRLWLRIFSFPLRIFVQIPKGSKLLVWSALPSTVSRGKGGLPPRLFLLLDFRRRKSKALPLHLRFFSSSELGLNSPYLSHLWVFAWVRPSNRNTGRIWRSTAVIRSASPRGISPCRRAFQSSTRYKRVRFLSRCGRGRGAFRLPSA